MSLCYDFEKWTIVSLAMVTISLSIGLVSLAHGQSIDNQTQALNLNNSRPFSIDIPDNWVYEEPNLFGLYVGVALTPNEFGEFLFDKTKPINEKMKDGGAYSTFSPEKWEYQIKNAGLDLFVKYKIDKQDAINVTAIQNLTIDGEPAVKVYADGIKSFSGIKFVQYMLMHDKEPYYLAYMANVKDFEKYLPEFEQMVKSSKFIDRE
jgi:hypothetical protein